ncbi:polymer-forming cytoskeletal protein [uncultured Pseudodesulfovibrio sp.]|uniref:bactofilin family protein n=1 Tax=uncultured Pseudodesulfovibrio sp. TaxID=2035858 RepID=UPI0029C79A59|nr:polymer-forming cytoskeletal protein [uncultured Pseudodesulfovibrio sp.]
MGIFSKKKSDNSELNAFLGVGTEYRGKLDFVGTVRIDGRFEGEISTDGDLILGRKASITGTVKVGRLTSCGRIEGDVVVKERSMLEKTSVLTGSLKTPVLVVEKGAVIEGSLAMTEGSTAVRPKVVTADFGGTSSETEESRVEVAETEESKDEVAKTGSDNTSI